MRPPKVVLLAARSAGQFTARVESIVRRGEVKALKVECRSCQRWVPARDWNPLTAVCEVCTPYVVAAAKRHAGLKSAGAASDGWSW